MHTPICIVVHMHIYIYYPYTYIYIAMHNINIYQYSNMYTHTVIPFLHHSTLRGPSRLEEGDFAVFFSRNRCVWCVAGYYKVGLKR